MFGQHFTEDINDSLLSLYDSLWKVKADYMVQEDNNNIFYFSK